MDSTLERDGRCDKRVAGRTVVANLHTAAHRLRRTVGEDGSVEPHITGQTVVVAVILEIRAEGLDELVAVHTLHKVVEHLDHVGLRAGSALFHIGIIAGDRLEGNHNIGIVVIRSVFHDCVEAQRIVNIRVFVCFHLDWILDGYIGKATGKAGGLVQLVIRCRQEHNVLRGGKCVAVGVAQVAVSGLPEGNKLCVVLHAEHDAVIFRHDIAGADLLAVEVDGNPLIVVVDDEIERRVFKLPAAGEA